MSLEVAAGRAALARAEGGLSIHFQPIADLQRGVVAGYEALARFAPGLRPDRVFAAAHAAGFGTELEALAVRTALIQRAALPANAFLTLNLGPEALLAAPVQELVAAVGDLRGVIVEITEQQPVADYAALREAMAPLRERGALVAIDDAGAGFASLQHITELHPDLIKVDRGLVAGVDRDPARAAVVQTLGLFASTIDAWLLAEGVETAGELTRLTALGVPLGQGYFLGRPAAAMGDVDPSARRLLSEHAATAARAGEDLAGLVTPAATVRAPAAADDLGARLHDARHVVVVDEFDRPTELVSGRGARRRGSAPLCAGTDEALAGLVRRAMARPEDARLDPVCLCDERGRLIGLINMESLVDRLAAGAEQRAAA
jgi:EAL domain-containing protein (putative c-di-GMP-specific phosphodiesterase class I)